MSLLRSVYINASTKGNCMKYKLILSTVIIFTSLNLSQGQSEYSNFNYTVDGRAIAWIYFTDKGPDTELNKFATADLISERALERRMRIRSLDNVIDQTDLPLHESYRQGIEQLVSKLRTESRWLNAVSVEVDLDQIVRLEELDFVSKVVPVHHYKKKPLPDTESEQLKISKMSQTSALDYGFSWDQVSLINANLLHDKGYFGQGVLICMLDDGFNLLNYHITFDSLRQNVLATWDFIHDDEDATDSEFKATEGWHGTKTLSTIAGYTPGELIGTAFKASFLLGKTEVDASETQIEEDYWVEGIEWAESLGADLVSSSLGYVDWDDGTGYTWEDMDGETAVTTIAAELAYEKGMMVFNSAGNEYDNADHNTLIAPADGNNVMAIGATYSDGTRASFSSVGPTADGRIKPDVAAMGAGITAASTTIADGFTTGGNGTSYSNPIAAGGAALLLNAFPQATPAQIYDAIRNTASQSQAPDKYLGWGVIDLDTAFNYLAASGLEENPSYSPERFTVHPNYPNPFNPKTTIRYDLRASGSVTISVFDLRGRSQLRLMPRNLSAGLHNQTINMDQFSSGMYIYQVAFNKPGSEKTMFKYGKMMLLK